MTLQELQDFGIDTDALLELIAEKAARSLVKVCRRTILKLLNERINASIDNAINDALKETLSYPYQPVNEWGEPQGELKTFKSHVKDRMATFWTEKVDNNGNASQAYGSRPRIEYIAAQSTKEVMASAFKDEVFRIIAEAKTQIRYGIEQSVSEIVKRLL